MKLKIYLISAVIVCLSGGYVIAQGHEDHEHMADSEEMQHMDEMEDMEDGPVNVGNKICPVAGGEIGSMGEGVQLEYEGKIYNLCCAMCAKDFKKNPEKYIEVVNEELESYDQAEEAEDEEDHHTHHDHDH